MKTITNILNIKTSYPFKRLGKLSDLVYFDIETTGFSAESCQLYLIGCVYYKNNSWHAIQWFCDTAESEPEVFSAFFDFIKSYKTLIHFNGDGFDIPFMKKRCAFLGLNYSFPNESIDIYRLIRPYRQLLGMEHMNQKSVESFLGLSREDKYNGGQLIEIYNEYLMTHNDLLYNVLMLHNAEDIKGMPIITVMLSYSDFFKSEFTYCGIKYDKNNGIISIDCKSDCNIPSEIIFKKDNIIYNAHENTSVITVPLYNGELKYFYPDYKNYYYLPIEDCAVHKSIGEFVDKSARKRATASNCYTKKTGLFLPQYSEVFRPAFKYSHKDKYSYVQFSPDLFDDVHSAYDYIASLLMYIGIA